MSMLRLQIAVTLGLSWEVAIIDTVPGLLKVTFPFVSTVAFVGSEEDHKTVLFIASTGETVARICKVLDAKLTVAAISDNVIQPTG